MKGADFIETVNPATGETLERIAYAHASDVDARLDRACAVQRSWAAAPAEERAATLRRVARRLRERRDRLAGVAVREMGKPIAQARAEVEKCAFACEYFAQHAAALLTDEPAQTNATRSYVAFRALGPLLAIMPWNFPYWQTFRAGIPALAAGNVLLLKHAARTTRCALETEALFDGVFDAGPLLQALLVSDEEADRLIGDRRIAAVTLTGSERAGVAVATAAGRALKKCVLELGGSDAFIVLADADMDAAVSTAVTARFQNNGQSCIAAKRFVVEERVHDAFLDAFASAAKALRIGDPIDEATQLGPCARADLRETLHRQVHDSLGCGARLVCGGTFVERAGFFYEPTVVADVAAGMRMFDEETFGPAAAVVRAQNADDAVSIANHSRYGLGCDIWTRDVDRGQRLAERVEAGNVWINGMVASDPRLPFGGVKLSGFGRELSHFGIHEFVNVQSVWIGPARQEG
ncbi:MAG TPA: aldehyde dehydrogenase family protein [Candidatus Dormibacteraeota bacterium]|nr:aldehyde dehydrogenase family protein [Candidatus Dormibacteraeota bacterium]